jgi:hypothetical protein
MNKEPEDTNKGPAPTTSQPSLVARVPGNQGYRGEDPSYIEYPLGQEATLHVLADNPSTVFVL